jgi:hypothetical protein
MTVARAVASPSAEEIKGKYVDKWDSESNKKEH